MLITGWLPSVGWAANATKNASAIRARTGNALEENTGADVNTASVRKKGHIKGDNHSVNWASDSVITPAPDYMTDAGIASMVRRMYSTNILNIQGPASAKTAMAAINLGTKAKVASLIWVTA
jgi:hypothetical protein